jgi:glycosyltransferase involved in cell wall biosynthesis
VEEVGKRLAHDIDFVVYCRSHQGREVGSNYLGMRRVVLPSLNTFQLDTLSHSLLSTIHVLSKNSADIVHYHGMGNALCLPVLLLSRKKTVVGLDGLDWERPKWGPVAKRVLKFSARLAFKLADHVIIDNKPAIEYYRRNFGLRDEEFTYIPYGADVEPPSSAARLDSLRLRPRGYLLFVGALVPDKGPDVLIEGFKKVRTEMPLVVVGDTPFAREFRRKVHEAAAADPRVRMLGYVYGDAYRQLVANAYAYVHPPRNEGTSPALLQAMGYGNCIVSSDIVEAVEVTGDAAITFVSGDPADLARQLERVLADPELADRYRRLALERVRAEYSWDDVAARHRAVYERVLGTG